MTDIRKGLTSASSFADDKACLGRRQLINSLPPEYLKPSGDEFTEFGNAVHKALETGNLSNLNDDQYETYKAVMAGEEQLLNEWTLNNGIEVITKWGREERFWIKDVHGNEIASAQLDRYWLATESRALIVDVKSLFAPHIPRAEESWQLKVQAACLFINLGCRNIRVAYNCPNKFGRKLDWHDFTAEDLQRFVFEIQLACWMMQQPDASRVPGEACRYCPARGVCPEAAAYSMLPSVVAGVAVGLSKQEIRNKVATLTPADWVFLWQRSTMVKNILESATSCLKGLQEDELNRLGLRFGKGRTTSSIPNEKSKEACERLSVLGLTEDDLWKCLSVDKTAAIELLQKHQRLSSKSKAEELFESELAGLIEEKTGEPTLREI